MPLRPCLNEGCPNLTRGTRCEGCQHERDRQRNASRPGHRSLHKKNRAKWEPAVNNGGINCNRCGERIPPGTPWDIDHRPDGWYPAHATCNRTAGAKHQP